MLSPFQGENARLPCLHFSPSSPHLPSFRKGFPFQQRLHNHQWSTDTPPSTSQPRAQPRSRKKGPLDLPGSSRAEHFDILTRYTGCSCLAQERKQKTLSGWQHWFLSKLLSFAVLSLIHSLCHAFTATGVKPRYKYQPQLNAHPTNAISPFAECLNDHSSPLCRTVCILSSVYYLLMVHYVPVWRVCLKLITGLLSWGLTLRRAEQLMHGACEQRAVPACGEQNKTGGDSPEFVQVMDVLLG